MAPCLQEGRDMENKLNPIVIETMNQIRLPGYECWTVLRPSIVEGTDGSTRVCIMQHESDSAVVVINGKRWRYSRQCPDRMTLVA